MMPPHLPPSLILLAAVLGSVMSNPDVEEINSRYSCCDRKMPFDSECKNTWQINNTPFAVSKTNQCIPPCVRLEDGEMTLDQCVAVNAIVVCNKQDVAAEQRIYYTNETCSRSGTAPGIHGSVGSVLLAVLIGGWFVKNIC